MSAAADNLNPHAAAAVAGDSSRLEQPKDAVAMERMPQEEVEKDEGGARVGSAPQDGQPGPISTESTDVKKTDNAPAEPSSAEAKGTDEAIETNPPKPPTKERSDSMAIGPAQDEIKAVTPGADDVGPVCNITLLLTSGSRHPYKISARYLSRRNVPIPEETEAGLPDPFSISVYTLKELILREWRNDWETKPASPSSIRLIHFGKLFDDKEPLKKYQLLPESPNVVHMSVRPQDLDEEEPKTGAKNAAQGGSDGRRERSGGCCVVL